MVSNQLDKFMKHVCSGSVRDILTNSIVLLYTPEEAVLSARERVLATLVEALVTQPEETKLVCA